MTWRLMSTDGRPYESTTPGTLGGHRRSKIYGRLDCSAALRAIRKGGYVRHRVFFADEQTAHGRYPAACAVCLPEHYKKWKAANVRTIA